MSMGWMTQVAIMPENPPIQKGWMASKNLVVLLFSVGCDVIIGDLNIEKAFIKICDNHLQSSEAERSRL